MHNSFKHVDTFFFRVSNLDNSIDWYTKTFGCRTLWKNPESGFAAIDMLGCPITLAQVKGDCEFIPTENAPFNIYSDNLEESRQYLEQQGIEVGPVEALYDVKWFWLKDPDGNRLEICNYVKPQMTR